MAKDSLIKNPDLESAYQVVPGSTDGQQTEELPTFTESELEAKFAADAPPAGSELVVTDGAPDGRMVVPASVQRPKFSKEFLEQNPDLQVAFAQSQMQSRGGTTTPASGQPTGDTPVVQPAVDTAGVVTTGAADAVTTPNADPNASANIQEGQIAKMNEVLDPVTGKPKQGTTPETKQGEVKTTPSQHMFPWGENGTTLESVMAGAGKNTPKRQILDDYFKWCQENGKPIDYITVNDIVNKSTDLAKSPVDEEKAKKRAERKAKFDQVGQFLLHLGNAIGNVAGGGYASMKLEDPVQWTERQRLLKEKAEQQQRLNTQSLWSQMNKERADQRALEVQKQNAQHQAKMEQIAERNAATAEARQQMYDTYYKQQAANNTRKVDADIEYKNKAGEAKMITAKKPKVNGGSGRKSGGKQDSETKTTYTRDRDGHVIESNKKTTYSNNSTKTRRKSKTQL